MFGLWLQLAALVVLILSKIVSMAIESVGKSGSEEDGSQEPGWEVLRYGALMLLFGLVGISSLILITTLDIAASWSSVSMLGVGFTTLAFVVYYYLHGLSGLYFVVDSGRELRSNFASERWPRYFFKLLLALYVVVATLIVLWYSTATIVKLFTLAI